MSKMALEQIREWMRDQATYAVGAGDAHYSVQLDAMADAIDAELKTRGEPVAECPDGQFSSVVTWLKPLPPKGTKLYTAPPAPKITNEALVKLARRCLWLAYVWNDHNFDAAHACARKTAEDVGIESFEEANTWLQALKETP